MLEQTKSGIFWVHQFIAACLPVVFKKLTIGSHNPLALSQFTAVSTYFLTFSQRPAQSIKAISSSTFSSIAVQKVTASKTKIKSFFILYKKIKLILLMY